MQSVKVSFAINEKEGLAELRRRQDEAGASSLGLYVKQLTLEHLAHDGDDKLAQVVEAIERLRQAELQTASTLAGQSRSIETLRTGSSPAEDIEALRRTLAIMMLAILQEHRPLTREQAEQIVRQLLEGSN